LAESVASVYCAAMDDALTGLWLCIECGETYEHRSGRDSCPRCTVRLVELGPNSLPDRVAALASAALGRRRHRLEDLSVILGALLGFAAGVGAASLWSALFVPVLTLEGILLVWLAVPSLWALSWERHHVGPRVPGLRPRLRLALAASLLVLPPLLVVWLRHLLHARS
jgi:hypothetical protein